MKQLVTTLGDKRADEVGIMLAHEHIFANFTADDDFGTPVHDVVLRMSPEVVRAQKSGVSALVEATAVGAGRRADILRAISEATKLPILVATGIFKEPAKREWVERCGEEGLRAWMTHELKYGIGDSDVRAGWIKLSVADEGVLPHERVLLRAAAGASRDTGAITGSHTVCGRVAHEELNIFEEAGGKAERFIWIHTQVEPDFNLHIEFARRGAWIEYDAIDQDAPAEVYVERILRALDSGLENRLLLSHDRVGYNPHAANGGSFKPYAFLCETFLPMLKAAGVDGATIEKLTRSNPFNAYAREN